MRLNDYKSITRLLTGSCVFLLVVLIIMIINAKFATKEGEQCNEILNNVSANCLVATSSLMAERDDWKASFEDCSIKTGELNKDVLNKQFNTLSQQSLDDILAMISKTKQPAEAKCYIPSRMPMKFYCGSELKYTCEGKFVNESVYNNCGCLLTEPNCGRIK